jgi:hypothetical protein
LDSAGRNKIADQPGLSKPKKLGQAAAVIGKFLHRLNLNPANELRSTNAGNYVATARLRTGQNNQANA